MHLQRLHCLGVAFDSPSGHFGVSDSKADESDRTVPAHKWTFKSRFRKNAYGWKGTALASKRLREAVSEIRKVAKSDPIAAADGTVSLMERIWPALQGIDGSSGALGSAVNRSLDAVIPVIVTAPADLKSRSKWLDRLYEAVCEDGVDYLSPVENEWANRMRRRDTISRELQTAAPSLGLTVAKTQVHDLQVYRDAAQQGSVVTRMGFRGRKGAQEMSQLFTELLTDKLLFIDASDTTKEQGGTKCQTAAR